MIVYGDRERRLDPRDLLAEIAAAAIRSIEAAGDCRRDGLVSALIMSGELVQGLADAEFAESGHDDDTDLQRTAMALAVALARLCLGEETTFPETAFAALSAAALPASVSCKTPEGYAFYAVDPLAYADVARRTAWPDPPMVIGLRSIGTSQAAAVAAALAAPTPITFRPQGPPFRRTLRLSDRLRKRLAEHAGAFAIVDEGPGLSGSSFACVAELLGHLGAAPERIVFMPSHAGEPGPRAPPEVRRLWAAVRRVPVTWESGQAARPIAEGFVDVIGESPSVEDLSGGAWRDDYPRRRRPPAWPAQERRKFRLRTSRGAFHARFAGLGQVGEAKLGLAQRLSRAGYAPEPLAIRDGFLLEPWVEGSHPDLSGCDRAPFLEHLSRYLAFRATLSPSNRGAGSAALRQMALANAEEAGGCDLGRALERALRPLEPITAGLVSVQIDGRLHPWEWRRTAEGFVKTDALDHACAHDLIGCQSIAWDLAGAGVEFDLTESEATDLAAGLGAQAPSRSAVRVFTLLYCAFQLGWWTFAAEGQSGDDAVTAGDRRDIYARRLAAELGTPSRPSRVPVQDRPGSPMGSCRESPKWVASADQGQVSPDGNPRTSAVVQLSCEGGK
ncbi:MAG TPA: hypothetical protein VFE13_15000 [Caulobacteraceae bacterium]|nr:hypothetical protein [Caulobacteraceae bacterium]